MARVRAGLGFCPRHTRQLVRRAEPAALSSIFEHVAGAGLAMFEMTETGVSGGKAPEELTAGLRPAGSCLACQSEMEAWRRRTRAITREITSEPVMAAITSSHPICLEHLLESWGELGGAAGPLRSRVTDLLAASAGEPSSGLAAFRGVDTGGGALVVGPDLFRLAPEPHSAPGRLASLVELQADLSSGGCPACVRAERELAAYVRWLASELKQAPYYSWATAGDLCRNHSWLLFHTAGDQGLAPLLGAMREQGLARLDRMQVDLSSGPRGRRLRPRRQPLAPLDRGHDCPACLAVRRAGERCCELLVRGLKNPQIARDYQNPATLCLPHLPMAVARCHNQHQAHILLGSARVLLSILRFELAEAGRRQAWDARWEPTSLITRSWWRAVEHTAGIFVRADPS